MRNIASLWLAVLFVALLVTPGPARGIEHQDILDAIQKKYTGMKTIRAQYVRITSTPSMEGVFDSSSTQTAEGALSFKKQAKLLLDQTYPRNEKLVTDGSTVWWWIPDEKLVHVYKNMDVYGEMKPLLDFFNGLSSLEGHFSVTVTPAGQAPHIHHRLDLTRLQEGSGPDAITVWCSAQDYTLVGFKLTSLTGETTVFNLTDVTTDQEMKDDLFTFTIPPGVEIVEEEGEMK